MNKLILSLLCFMLSLNIIVGKSTLANWNPSEDCTSIYDFETTETSTDFQQFGGDNENQFTKVIDNPNSSGINTSAKVVEYTKANNAPSWGGMFKVLSTPIDGTNGGQVCINVHMDHIGNLTLKLEDPVGGGDNWISSKANTKTNEWEQLCFDLSANSFQDSQLPAKGRSFGKLVLFFDFDEMTAMGLGATSYFDDIEFCPGDAPSAPTCNSIYDFETTETTTDFQQFGGDNENQFTKVIDNPNSSGINTSTKVVEYTKANNAPSWGGMFKVLPTPIDGTSGGKVCIDVHMDHIGNLALKLEEPVGGGDNWITKQINTKTNEWEQLCFDLSINSFQDSQQPAKGRSFGKLVLFFDFDEMTAMGLGATSYFDNIQFCQEDSGPQLQEVSFAVDMNSYDGNFTKVYLSGTFNEWSGTGDPLSDDDMDGIWTIKKTINNGSYEYKFTMDDWTGEESFNGSETCTKMTITETDVFVNRLINVTASAMGGDTVCYNSCYACGTSAKITMNLGTSGIMPSEEGLYLAGGAEFGAPNARFRMTDENEDGIYSLTIERPIGYEGFYTFTNGACGNFSCKENIVGQDCASGEFSDRFLTAIMKDTTINTCFGECTTTTECAPPPAMREVIFNVDMSGYSESFSKVYVNGSFNEWSGSGFEMTDADADGIFTDTLMIADGSHQYKFHLDDWLVQETLMAGSSCTVTAGDFTNRLLDLAADSSLCFVWSNCTSCMSTSTNNLEENENLFRFSPNPTDQYTVLNFENLNEEKQVKLFSVAGELLYQQTAGAAQNQLQLNTSHLPKGMYIINVQTEQMISTKKLLKL